MSTPIDESTLALLTDEERAAIADTDSYSPEELAAMQALADGAPARSDADDEDDENDDASNPAAKVEKPADQEKPAATPKDADADAAAAAAAEAAATAKPGTEATKADATHDAKAKEFTPRYESKLPEDYEAQVAALRTQEAALRTQFKDGDLEFEAYEEKRDALQKQREDLMVTRVKSEVSQDLNTQTAEQQWQANVDSFLTRAAKEDGGIDYRADQAKAADLDQFVKVLASRADNSDKSMEWFLVEADRRVKALHGIAAPAKEAVAAANAARKPDLSEAPKTLAQVPGSAGAIEGESEFANIDNLEGEELEAAIAKMTPAQRKRFEKA